MYSALRLAREELREFLQRRGVSAPAALADVEVDFDQDNRDLRFNACFVDGSRHRWSIHEYRLTDGYYFASARSHGPQDFFEQLRSSYARLFEDHLLELEVATAHERFHAWARECGDPGEIHWRRRELDLEIRHIREHHRNRYVGPPVWMGMDLATEPDTTTVVQMSVRGLSRVESEPPLSADDRDDLRRLQDRLANRIDRDFTAALLGGDIGNPEAQAKGDRLLRAWLSPEQLAQYDAHKHFEVIGSASGTRYRIRHGRQLNIDQLDPDGRKVCGWCFLPEGGLVAGDVMLAQKIALETDEAGALKIANQIVPNPHDVLMAEAFRGDAETYARIRRRPGMRYVGTVDTAW